MHVRGRARGLAVLAAMGALAAACSSGSGEAVGGGLGDAARAASDASAEAALQDGSRAFARLVAFEKNFRQVKSI